MKKLILLLSIFFISYNYCNSQSFIKKQVTEAIWDQGVPICLDDPYITDLIDKVGFRELQKSKKEITKNEAKLCREIGVAFYNKGMYDAADWYLERVKEYVEIVELEPEKVFGEPVEDEEEIPADIAASLAADKAFLDNLPKSYDDVSPSDMKNLAKKIENQLQKLITEKENLIKNNTPKDVIDAKDATINTLGKEKKIIDLNIETGNLKIESKGLKIEKETLKKYITWLTITLSILGLGIVALFQRKTIKVKDVEIEKQLQDINKKNTYLEHAAYLIRHDMHSGINTYIPRGLGSLEKRISAEELKSLKIDGAIKMIKEGLNHTQRVYKSVYEFTNLVKQKVVLDKVNVNIKELLNRYLLNTSYKSQVNIEDLGELEVNETLFCNAIDNLIRNGLKYNNSEDKFIRIYKENNNIIIQDNGVGLTQKQFDSICFNYVNKKNKDIDKSTNGLGLNICLAILEEHGFKLTCERDEIGTKMIINLK
jgi:signal transduction histidine kinase